MIRQSASLAPLEKEVRRSVLALYAATGCQVYDLSRNIRTGPKGTGQTPGLPDLWVFPPNGRPPFWHELKAPDRAEQLQGTDAERMTVYRRKQSVKQRGFERLCERSRHFYVLGGYEEAARWLRALGVIVK